MKILLSIVLVGACIGGLIVLSFTRQRSVADPGSVTKSANDESQLSERLEQLCKPSGGRVSVAVLHLETGKSVDIDGSNELPLYSVFKLPLAVAVLKHVEEDRLKLDQKVHIEPKDVIGGSRSNTDRWKKPVDLSIKDLIALSIIESDNTSTDKLLELVGGPAAVTERMQSVDLQQINVRLTIKQLIASRTNASTGSALGLVKLLSRLQRGDLLQPAHTELLLGFMERAKTGMKRLRGNLPAGTMVADKTGSGELNETTKVASTTNDVGLITLPNGKGRLAMAVLLRDSTLPDEQQEKLIADLACAAFDHFSASQR